MRVFAWKQNEGHAVRHLNGEKWELAWCADFIFSFHDMIHTVEGSEHLLVCVRSGVFWCLCMETAAQLPLATLWLSAPLQPANALVKGTHWVLYIGQNET